MGKDDQQELRRLGFDTTRSYNGANWGGAHASLGYFVNEDGSRVRQLRAAHEAGKRFNMKQKKFRVKKNNKRSYFMFESETLRRAVRAARHAGWKGKIREKGYHVSIHFTKDGFRKLNEIIERLRQAKWGFVLSKQSEKKSEWQFDWENFLPVG